MGDRQISNNEGNSTPIYLYYVYAVIIITIILTILRIIFYFYEDRFFSYNRDVDFKTLHVLMDNGLINYYNGSSIGGFRALYLYFWYFLFYPIYVLPLEVSVYIWDSLRLISSIFIAKRIDKITDNSTDKVIFFILMGFGFFADAYLNNTNWLIQILLFQSYNASQKERKWLAGILFTLSIYKINIIVFPFILLIIKRIKIKDLLYYIIPSGLILLPYALFPEYFWQMFYNWTYIEVEVAANMSLLLKIYLFSWQVFQTAQLMYLSLFILIFLEKIRDSRWRNRFRILIIVTLIVLNLTFPIILWPILYG